MAKKASIFVAVVKKVVEALSQKESKTLDIRRSVVRGGRWWGESRVMYSISAWPSRGGMGRHLDGETGRAIYSLAQQYSKGNQGDWLKGWSWQR